LDHLKIARKFVRHGFGGVHSCNIRLFFEEIKDILMKSDIYLSDYYRAYFIDDSVTPTRIPVRITDLTDLNSFTLNMTSQEAREFATALLERANAPILEKMNKLRDAIDQDNFDLARNLISEIRQLAGTDEVCVPLLLDTDLHFYESLLPDQAPSSTS
jgi:hypothetical protein